MLSMCLHRMPAVDGAGLDLEELPSWLLEARTAQFRETTLRYRADSMRVLPGALGRALSHCRVWQALAAAAEAPGAGGAAPRPWALVLEDDLGGLAQDFPAQLRRILAQLPADWDMCLLGFHELESPAGDHTPALGRGGSASLVERRVRGVRGTFAYLLSSKGACRLLEPGTVLPLSDRRCELDAAMSAAFPWLSVWATRPGRPLVFLRGQRLPVASAPPGDAGPAVMDELEDTPLHHKRLGVFASGLVDRDEDWAPGIELATPRDAAEAARSRGRRRCAFSAMADPGALGLASALSSLRSTVASLQQFASAPRGGTKDCMLPIVVVWFGENASVAAQVEETFPECCVLRLPSFADEVDQLLPGMGALLRPPVLIEFMALQCFQALQLDQLFYLSPGSEVLCDVFEDHADAELYAPAGVVSPKHAKMIEALGTGPCRAMETFALLFNRCAWLEASRWTQEMMRIWARTYGDLPCDPNASAAERAQLAAMCAISAARLEVAELVGVASLQPAGVRAALAANLGCVRICEPVPTPPFCQIEGIVVEETVET